MTSAQRSIGIIKSIRDNGAMSVKKLSVEFGVSEMTIRRDLQSMVEKDVVRMMHGLAFLRADADDALYDLMKQQGVMYKQKDAIGRLGASLLKGGDTVFIDCGSTAAAMSQYIPRKMDITVVCSTANVMVEMQRKEIDRMVFSGGFYHKSTQTFESPEAVKLLGSVRANKAFVSAAGASRELGLTCMNQYEVGLKKVELANAQTKILLMDSSKFDRVTTAFFGTWQQIDQVITDDKVSDDWRQFFEDKGIELLIAK